MLKTIVAVGSSGEKYQTFKIQGSIKNWVFWDRLVGIFPVEEYPVTLNLLPSDEQH